MWQFHDCYHTGEWNELVQVLEQLFDSNDNNDNKPKTSTDQTRLKTEGVVNQRHRPPSDLY